MGYQRKRKINRFSIFTNCHRTIFRIAWFTANCIKHRNALMALWHVVLMQFLTNDIFWFCDAHNHDGLMWVCAWRFGRLGFKFPHHVRCAVMMAIMIFRSRLLRFLHDLMKAGSLWKYLKHGDQFFYCAKSKQYKRAAPRWQSLLKSLIIGILLRHLFS